MGTVGFKRAFALVFVFCVSFSFSTTYLVKNTAELDSVSSLLISGDTLELKGGRYHTQLDLSALNGTEVTVIRALKDTLGQHTAVLDGSVDLSGGFTLHSGSIYKKKLTQPIWQLFVNGVEQTSARWPNMSISAGIQFDRDGLWAKTDSSFNGYMQDADIPVSDLSGAVVVMNSGSFRSYASNVQSSTAGKLMIDSVPSHRGGKIFYFIDAHLDLLDTAEEWFFDPVDSMLYVYGDPSDKMVRGRVQDRAILADGAKNVQIEGLNFFATGFAFKNSENITIKNSVFSYPGTNRRMLKESGSPVVLQFEAKNTGTVSNFVFENNVVEHTDGEALYIKGSNNIIRNNYMHHIDYTATSRRGLAVSLYHNGKNLLFTGNTVHTTGSSSFIVPGETPELSHNDIFHTGFVQNDGSVFQLTRSNVQDCKIHHNWIHDTHKYGIRFDAPSDDPALAGKYGEVHHNMLWNLEKAMMLKGDSHYVYNNTVLNSTKNDIILLAEANGNVGTIFFNNLAQKISAHRSGDVQTYPLPSINYTNYNGYVEDSLVVDLLVNVESLNFAPKSSLLIDQGSVQDGYPAEYSGDKPDIGAYESGMEYWTAGTTLDTASMVWPWDVNGYVPTAPTNLAPVLDKKDSKVVQGRDALGRRLQRKSAFYPSYFK